MATEKQVEAARRNIKKAQEAWQKMSSGEGRDRAKPGEAGLGEFYRIVVRPKSEFVTFRNQDVGQRKGIERLAGQRSNGSWDTQAWLISKRFAHMEGDKLVGDNADAREIIAESSPVTHVEGDIFEGKPRRDIPENEKPTPAMRRAEMANIKKAQESR